MPRLARIVAAAAALLACAPAAAAASTASVADGRLQVVASDRGGDILIEPTSAGFAIHGAIEAGANCARDAGRVLCPAAGVTAIAVSGSVGDDRIVIRSRLPAAIDGGDGNDALYGGDGNDRLEGGPGADHISGGGGTDTVTYARRTEAVSVTLDGARNDGEAGEEDLVGAGVEILVGGAGADTLVGGAGGETLTGNAGDDLIDGGAGADVMSGQGGTDTVSYAGRAVGVSITADGRANDGEPGEKDSVGSDIDGYIGGTGDDTIVGNHWRGVIIGGPGDDRIDGNGGDDRIVGGVGADEMDGGDGTDTVDYGGRAHPVGVDLGRRDGHGEAGEGDLILDVEIAHGGDAGDSLRGDDNRNRLHGGPGDDTLDGRGGADVLSGGDGWDAADYSERRHSVAVSLNNSANDGEDDEDDDVRDDVEEVRGGHGGDRLHGDGDRNVLAGGPGADDVRGGAGDDLLDAGGDGDRVFADEGDDTILGGDGDDRLKGNDGADTIDGGGGANQMWGGGGDDHLRGGPDSDKAWGEDGRDELTAAEGDDELDGGEGDDTLAGGPGNDALEGEGGNDGLSGGEGDDHLDGDHGDEVLFAEPGADQYEGDEGEDVLSYAGRRGGVNVDFDGDRDDGERGEGDTVHPSVEEVIGGDGDDRIVMDGQSVPNRVSGGPGKDVLAGAGAEDLLEGGPGPDVLIGVGDGAVDVLDGGAGRDRARSDRRDKRRSIERNSFKGRQKVGERRRANPAPARPAPRRRVSVRRVVGGGRFVPIPGFPGERIDRRLLGDIAYLRARFGIWITDGFSRSSVHTRNGEHPLGLGVDIVPGPGGSWDDIDRLARWAEPRQNRPRLPFRWVGYKGDRNHGRGHHLHLSWAHSPARFGRPARQVWVLTRPGRRTVRRTPSVRSGRLTGLARRLNRGGHARVRTGIGNVAPCSGAGPLVPTWRAAARAFGLNWKVLAAITKVESNFGCNMGPSSAGALGWTQFMPATWKRLGMDANGNGKASPYESVDAIFSTARYLRHEGAPRNYRRALFAYNHAHWYVRLVLRTAREF